MCLVWASELVSCIRCFIFYKPSTSPFPLSCTIFSFLVFSSGSVSELCCDYSTPVKFCLQNFPACSSSGALPVNDSMPFLAVGLWLHLLLLFSWVDSLLQAHPAFPTKDLLLSEGVTAQEDSAAGSWWSCMIFLSLCFLIYLVDLKFWGLSEIIHEKYLILSLAMSKHPVSDSCHCDFCHHHL